MVWRRRRLDCDHSQIIAVIEALRVTPKFGK